MSRVLAKNSLRAAQDRDVIAIVPTGRRVCEFHPREKKPALIDTSICTAVAIYEYRRRSGKDGEQAEDYDIIYSYY